MIGNSTRSQRHVLVAVNSQDDFWPLLNVGYALASHKITIITVRQSGEVPDWMRAPSSFTDIFIEVDALPDNDAARAILRYARQSSPDLLIVGWSGGQDKKGYALGRNLDRIVQQAPCNLLVVKAKPTWPDDEFLKRDTIRVLVPTAGGPNMPLAMDLAFGSSKEAEVSTIYIMPQDADEASLTERDRWLAELTQPWTHNGGLESRVVQHSNIIDAIATEALNFDITLVGIINPHAFSQVLFGHIPQKIALANPRTTVLVKKFSGSYSTIIHRMWWQATHFLPSLSFDERVDVYKQIRRGARPKVDFFMMIGLAAGIAALGLLVNSPAVIIGAMLVAPLMAAIVGIGLAMIQADGKLLALSISATVRGMLLAIGMGFAAGFLLQPVSEPTQEILSRTNPTLFDLGVALISGIAGAYAVCRKNVSSSLPGVAIAAALVPPLATVGIGLAWLDFDISNGAIILFLTNLVAISAASGLVFFILGFRPHFNQRGGLNFFSSGVIGTLLVFCLMVWVLWSFSVDTFNEAVLEREIDRVLEAEIPQLSRTISLDSWHFAEYDEDPPDVLNLEVQVRARSNPAAADVADLQKKMGSALQNAGFLDKNQPFKLVLIVIPTTAIQAVIPPASSDPTTPQPEPTIAPVE